MFDVEQIGNDIHARINKSDLEEIRDLERAAVESEDFDLLFEVCSNYIDKGEMTDALRVLDKADEIDPDTYEVSLVRANIYYFGTSEKQKSLDIWNEIAKDDEENYAILARMYIAYHHGKYDLVLDEFETLMRIDPELDPKYVEGIVTSCLLVAKRYQEARTLCLDVLQKDHSLDALRMLGVAEEYLGNKKTAKEIYKKLMEIDPGDEDIYRRLLYCHLKDFEWCDAYQTMRNFAKDLENKDLENKAN